MIKKIGLSAFSLLLIASPLFAGAAQCPNLSRTLSLGSHGQDVVELQNFLIAEGTLAAGNNTGYFGKLTESAVKKWQASHGIVSSGAPSTTGYGVVGKKTRAAIASACASASSGSSQAPVHTPPPAPAFQPQCPLVQLPIGQTCNGTWKEVKDAKGCTASWKCE